MTVIENASERSAPTETDPRSQAESGHDFDALLQLSRRVDWRFLLPVPRVGHAACVGQASAEHVAALRCFADSLTLFPHVPHLTGTSDRFEVVVSSAARFDELDMLAECVRPDGWLYLEIFGRTGPAEFRQKSAPPDFARKLARLAFTDIAAYWVWPDFENCTQLVPLADPVAVRHAIGTGGAGIRSRVRSLVGRALFACGVLDSFVGSFCILARRLPT